jgi:hypothetical protein
MDSWVVDTQTYFDGHLEYPWLFTFESTVAFIPYRPLRREPRRLKPSDLAMFLQYGSGPPYNFLAKTLGVDTPLFLFNTVFYFQLPSLLVHKS